MNTQISFVEGTYSLIHIPLDLYAQFFQAIIKVLLPYHGPACSPEKLSEELKALNLDGHKSFLNISITPIECSIVCHTAWVNAVFKPVINSLSKEVAKTVSISKDTYLVLYVISAGLMPAQRVIDLTSPLALAGISIFFISTYYSDFLLVPSKARAQVVQVLNDKNFQLDSRSIFTSTQTHGRTESGSSDEQRPLSPPPPNLAELQKRSFDLLRKRNVVPHIDSELELVHCSGRDAPNLSGDFSHVSSQIHDAWRGAGGHQVSWFSELDTKLYLCIVHALASKPRFMSVTFSHEDPPAFTLDTTLRDTFADSVVGDFKTKHTPIFLDLENLPAEVTGIVCGVAGKLVEEMEAGSADLAYLSTARAGAVMLPKKHSERAMRILRPLLGAEEA